MIKLSFIFLILINSSVSFATTFRICYESPHFFPYEEDGGSKQKLGPVIKLIKFAAQQAQLETKFIRTSWARCLEDAKHNNVDAVLTSLWTKEREKFLVFPRDLKGNIDPTKYLLKAKYKIYTHIDSKVEWDGLRIKNTITGIGAPANYVAKDKLKDLQVLKETDLLVKQAFDLIIKKRLDGYVVLKDVGDIILKDYIDKSLIKELEKNFIEDNLYIPVSYGFFKKHPLKSKAFFNQLSKERDKFYPRTLR
ncbi:substrate-binding periplasmic protein [Halobacteriovorax sp.]|uniref:substrate-binding periplasmic protein n=1 Tax=Halobacteriovorax sp. TaxID=2020862 RepID=UPI0035663ACD